MPFSFTGDDKLPAGYSIDVCKAVVVSIQEQLKLPALPIRWVAVTAESRFQAVAQNRVDLECGSTTITLARSEQVDFSAPIFIETGSVLVRADSEHPAHRRPRRQADRSRRGHPASERCGRSSRRA
jgi:ABC-type amino acid transport substrate-binding protein